MSCFEKRKREKTSFVHQYVNALLNGRAAIFAGAGLSIPSGELSWPELLKKDAESIGLDIAREDNLIEVAQYIYNESGTRNTITSLLKNYVDKKGSINKNHNILASLPITTYWTTNYDTYIERSIESVGKIVDVKRSINDLASEIQESNVTIYKMHGDITSPNTTVLLKEDYEIYDKKNELFVKKLQGDLLSNTFLFIGFSFDDPNLENILAKLSILLDGNPRTHYCFLKKVSKEDAEFEKIPEKDIEREVEYRKLKQELKINDLRRYGIRTILVKEYEEITEILKKIKNIYVSNRVFISGAFDEIKGLKEINDENMAINFSIELGRKLYESGYKVSSGLGQGVGRGIITGFLNAFYKQNKQLTDELLIRPFPIDNDQHDKHREELIKNCGIVIFLFGNKFSDGKILLSDGIMKEYNIAKRENKFIIAVPHTGYSALKIWEKEKSYLNELAETEIGINSVVDQIISMIENYQKTLLETFNSGE